MMDVVDKALDQLAACRARIAELEAALRKIADPIAWLKASLEPGQQIDGGGAYALSNDPTWLKKVARDALAPKPTKE
jgi:hypothetical protein